MKTRDSRLPLVVSAVASVVLHLLVLLPLIAGAMMQSGASPHRLVSRLDAEDPPERDEPELELGIESSATSTLSWIGYDEYVEHLALLSETDQAAFSDAALAAAPPAPDSIAAPVMIDAAEPSPDARADEPPVPSEPPPASGSPADPQESAAEPTMPEARDPAAVLPELDVQRLARLIDRLRRETDRFAELLRNVELADAGTGDEPALPPTDEPPSAPESDALAEVAATEPAESSESSDSGAADAEPGDPSDRESDPTSTIDVPLENWKLGKPLAAHGLTLKPRRPVFQTLTLLTALPRNPLCEIEFDREGRVPRARLVRETGDRSVDAAVLASLYDWRATGERLSELDGERTIVVRMKIILVDR